MVFIFHSGESRYALISSGMGESSDIVAPAAAGSSTGHYTAFDFNSDRYTVRGHVSDWRTWVSNECLPAECSGISVIQRDILIINFLSGRMEGFGGTCLVIAVGSGVVGVKRKTARMGDFEAVAAVCPGRNFFGGVGPHCCRSDDTALFRVCGPARCDNFTAYYCGVGWGCAFFGGRVAGIEK